MSAKTADEIRAELDERYAKFCLRPLGDADVWALSMATMVMPDGNPGAEAYLAQVSGTTLFGPRLAMWGRVVALGIAQAGYKAPGGSRRRSYVEGYDESWGRYAVADGLSLALYGKAEDALGKSKDQGYRRIRDFVGSALVNAIEEYRVALEWATGYRRDRVLAGRWEGITGLNFGEAMADAKMGREKGVFYPMFAPGCAVTGRLPDLDDLDKVPDNGRGSQVPPETLYRSLRPTDWWDAECARRMKDAPVKISFPRHGTLSPAAE